MKKLSLLILFCGLSAFAMKAPRFQGELLGGGKTSLEQSLKSEKGLLVCFWASWCVPCLEELSQVMAGVKANPNTPLEVLTINVDNADTSADVKPTVKQYGLPFPVILDPTHKIFTKYQKQAQLPFSVLLSPSGEIIHTFKGVEDGMFDHIKSKLEAALPAKKS